jgi:hypothetical protein
VSAFLKILLAVLLLGGAGVAIASCSSEPPEAFSTIKPTPRNPCWVIWVVDDSGYIEIIVIDAVEGKILGHGVPPP